MAQNILFRTAPYMQQCVHWDRLGVSVHTFPQVIPCIPFPRIMFSSMNIRPFMSSSMWHRSQHPKAHAKLSGLKGAQSMEHVTAGTRMKIRRQRWLDGLLLNVYFWHTTDTYCQIMSGNTESIYVLKCECMLPTWEVLCQLIRLEAVAQCLGSGFDISYVFFQ